MEEFSEALKNLSGEEKEEVEKAEKRYHKLIAEADAIAGKGGLERFLKLPLIYGISAALIFLGIILFARPVFGATPPVIAASAFILTGSLLLFVALILFLKFKKAQPLYKEATAIKAHLEKQLQKARYLENHE